MSLDKLLQDYLTSCKTMQLATISDGLPWICTVYFVTDENNRIYWTSAKSRRHSKEILENPEVAVAIVKDTEKKQALQITGKAAMVPLTDVEQVNALYGSKYGDKPERLAEVQADTPDGRAYWVVEPATISFWDEVNFPKNPKQEYSLG